MVTNTSLAKQSDHIERINKAVHFIDAHLNSELTLEAVAAVACYSPFHFHRIFKASFKEPLNVYITRRRIEKAASILIRNADVTIGELSAKYGFNSNAAFTRAFKKFYGVSPTEFQKQCPGRFSKIGKAQSKNGEKILAFTEDICSMENHINWLEANATVEVKEIPELQVAYILHVGHDHLAETFRRLMKWARSKDLMDTPDPRILLIYHNSFKITEPNKIRMSAGIVLRAPVKAEGEIGLTTIQKGKYLVGHLEIADRDFEKAWSSLYVWMNDKGYKKADKDSFEVYLQDPQVHPEKKYIVDLFIPIV